ncbi:hypothetical protein UCRPC4_g01078 [Phaeomoniella chlamydospora]|uniref:Uncharacterized protein n=1 Tax=Phaeomoniella chlamydospora TaxID=158046 RepID=A0A0G2GW79_PHACM|nr:hypothetical protein UCRPC4_g01078 [Phaeomoniella chlamydospora]
MAFASESPSDIRRQAVEAGDVFYTIPYEPFDRLVCGLELKLGRWTAPYGYNSHLNLFGEYDVEARHLIKRREELRMLIRHYVTAIFFEKAVKLDLDSGKHLITNDQPPSSMRSGFATGAGQDSVAIDVRKLISDLPPPFMRWYSLKLEELRSPTAEYDARKIVEIIQKYTEDRQQKSEHMAVDSVPTRASVASNKLLVQCLLNRASVALNRIEPEKALDLATEALGLASSIEDDFISARCWYWIALAQYRLGKQSEAAMACIEGLPAVAFYPERENLVSIITSMREIVIDILVRASDEEHDFWSQWLDAEVLNNDKANHAVTVPNLTNRDLVMSQVAKPVVIPSKRPSSLDKRPEKKEKPSMDAMRSQGRIDRYVQRHGCSRDEAAKKLEEMDKLYEEIKTRTINGDNAKGSDGNLPPMSAPVTALVQRDQISKGLQDRDEYLVPKPRSLRTPKVDLSDSAYQWSLSGTLGYESIFGRDT